MEPPAARNPGDPLPIGSAVPLVGTPEAGELVRHARKLYLWKVCGLEDEALDAEGIRRFLLALNAVDAQTWDYPAVPSVIGSPPRPPG